MLDLRPNPWLLRLSASSLFLRSRRQLFCSGGWWHNFHGSRTLRTERASTAISGFRVYFSGRTSSRAAILARIFCSNAAGSDHLVGRLACHFNFVSKRSPYRNWIAPSRLSLLTVLIPTRSLKADGPEVELELEESFRGRQPASVKTGNKASSSSTSVQQRTSREENLSFSSIKGQSKRSIGVKPNARDFVKKGQRSGNESFDGRRPSSRGVNNSSKQFSDELLVVGGDTPVSQSPKLSVKHSRAPHFLKRTTLSGGVTPSAATVGTELFGDNKVTPKVLPAASSVMNSNQNSNRRKQVDEESKLSHLKVKKRRMKDRPPAEQLRRDLNNCSKDGDVLRALDIYERSVSEGVVTWNQYNFNILLYLCSSAALGTLTARKASAETANAESLNHKPSEQTLPLGSANGVERNDKDSNGHAAIGGGSTIIPISLSPEVMEMAGQRGFEIFEDMKKQGVPPNEATLTAVARLAIKKEDGDMAFQMVKEMAAHNIAPKLRSYGPALVTFCTSKAVEKAFEVDAHMMAAGVQPEEPELGALLQLCVEERLEKKLYSLLHRLRTRVRALSSSTISSIEEWFSGQAGASAGDGEQQPDIATIHHAMVAGGGGWHGLGWLGKGPWKPEWTTIDSEGFCRSCKNKLVTIDLDSTETDNFAQSVAEVAFARETRPNDFTRFQEWLERNGPFDAIIDGANVGLHNQNFQQGGFNFFQLKSVAEAAVDLGLVKKPPLIILHHARTKFGAANSPLGRQLLRQWSSSNTLYTTPYGSNDDWYWMYAAVRNKCLLITNDEMRDHLFQLLGNDFFPKWKERHQVRFSATARGPQFHLPPPYSLVIQESGNGSWHIPKDRGSNVDAPHEWICVTRPGVSIDNAVTPVSEVRKKPTEAVAIPTQPPDATMVGQGSDN